MIPKIIHYCWFGRKPIPKNVLTYIQSWKKYLPDCQIKEWNESNFDINQYKYTQQAYYAKKYAFVSDVARLYALVNEGGLYLDTDILFLRPLDSYLWAQKAFIGFEHETFIGTGLIAAEANHPFFKDFLFSYQTKSFFKGLKYNEETNVAQITNLFIQKGLLRNNTKQFVDKVLICPQNYFCNKDWRSGQYYNNEKSFAIHDFQSSWSDKHNNFFQKASLKIRVAMTICSFSSLNFLKKNFHHK